jgi:hypothetical protein
VPLAPDGPVKEIGNVFRRVLCLLDDAEADEIVMLSKIDLSDGFWQMIVTADQVWNFCYVMPDPNCCPIGTSNGLGTESWLLLCRYGNRQRSYPRASGGQSRAPSPLF